MPLSPVALRGLKNKVAVMTAKRVTPFEAFMSFVEFYEQYHASEHLTVGQHLASDDLIVGRFFASEDLRCSRARQAPDPWLGAHHLSQPHWSGSFSRQQP